MDHHDLIANHEFFVHGNGRIKLRVLRSTLHEAIGVIVIVHGVGEHLGRYQYFISALLAQGYSCYVYDQRGHGRSEGIRGDVASFHDYADDLDAVYQTALNENPQLPLYVFGHSMGSIVVLLNLIAYPGKWRGAIVSGVPLKLVKPIPKWLESAAKIGVKVFPLIPAALNIDPASLCHDPAIVDTYKTDKLVQRKVTIRWGLAFSAAVREVEAKANQIGENLLILHGGDDPVSHADGAKQLAGIIGHQQATLIIYPGLFHEPHNEPETDRNREFNDIQMWLAKQNV